MGSPLHEVPAVPPPPASFLPYRDTGLFAVTNLDNQSFGFSPGTDLVPGVNEGGLRIWECTKDLINYLRAHREAVEGKRVLELGCGHGLPGIVCIALGAREVVFQDYNEEVLRRVTMANVHKNLGSLSGTRYVSGPWDDYSPLYPVDLIITSETVYNPANYPALLLAMRTSLAGECILACKTYYFGVGGGTEIFAQAASAQGFRYAVEAHFEDGKSTLRDILRLWL